MKNHGNVAIETALIAPLVLLALLGTLETGLMLYLRNVMELAIADGAHLQTLDGTAWPTREEYVRSQLQAVGGGLFNPARLSFQAENVDGEVMVYRAVYSWHLFTPFLGTVIGDGQGNMPITSSFMVRNISL